MGKLQTRIKGQVWENILRGQRFLVFIKHSRYITVRRKVEMSRCQYAQWLWWSSFRLLWGCFCSVWCIHLHCTATTTINTATDANAVWFQLIVTGHMPQHAGTFVMEMPSSQTHVYGVGGGNRRRKWKSTSQTEATTSWSFLDPGTKLQRSVWLNSAQPELLSSQLSGTKSRGTSKSLHEGNSYDNQTSLCL